MNDTTRINIVVVDLAKTLLRESSCMLLATGDEYANRFGAIIVRNGEAVDIANFLVSGSFIRPDGVTLTLEGVSEGNTVYVDLPSECYKYDGVFTLSIKIVKGDVTETVRMVDGYIRRTETGNYVADEETIITLDKIQGMANEMAQLYEQAKETMEELSGATENLENALEEAETLPEKLPYIGDNGNWMQWDDDAGKFIDSGSPSRGIPGVNGTTPVKGKDYFDGEPGYTPQKNIDYFDGTSVTVSSVSESTADGGTNVVTFSDGKKLNVKNGSKGNPGEPGRTPQKGTDYFTEADKAELVEEVKSQIGEVDGDYAPAIHADQHSWNDTLTWDGDTTGRVVFFDGYDNFCLVSDVVPTLDDLANGFFGVYQDSDGAEAYPYYTTFEDIEDGGWVYPGGGVYAYDFVIVPTDNYTFTGLQVPPTFPKKGIYFGYWPDGFIFKSLTIPGFVFESGSDPITPEMIGAAPSYHASESGEYGMGTAEKYGHLKVADVGDVFTAGEEKLLDIAIELPSDDPMIDLKPYALGAYTGYACLNLLTTYVKDHDEAIVEHNSSIRNLQQQTLKQDDRQSIITDALAALAGADPNNATAAVIETLSGRTGNLEIKYRNMAEDMAWLQRDVDSFTYSFIALHHPLPAPEDPEKMTFAYTSWVSDYENNEWYDDITLLSLTGDVYAGRMIDKISHEYTREKLATEKYVQNAMILTSPNGSRFRITVNDDGTLSTTPVT